MRRIVLVGLGPHARRIYYPMLERASERYDIELSLVVELSDQRRVVEDYLAGRSLQPKAVVYLPDGNRDGAGLHPDFLDAVESAGAPNLWGLLIACEPRARKMYTEWALERGLHTLLDKPVTAFDLRAASPESALGLVDDFYDLRDAARRSGANCLVQTQRRAHLGYQTVRDYLRDFLHTFGVPITYVDVYHADGMWNMPEEFFGRENHPYKYGYGKIMHSGYHLIDTVTWLTSLNDELPPTAPDRLEICTRRQRPYDFLSQVGRRHYETFFGAGDSVAPYFSPESMAELREFGETDVFMLGQFRRGDAVMTTVSLNLLQTSFSRRSWFQLPADTYRGNGRVRHERLTVQVGHLLNVQLHTYQSTHIASEARNRPPLPGDFDHIDVHFYRNSALVGGAPFERFDVTDDIARKGNRDRDYLGQFESAREELLTDFLAEDDRRAALAGHELPIKIVASAYYAMRSASRGRPVTPEIDLAAGRSGWLLNDPLREESGRGR
ncbi:hypothetical protein GCM10010191_11350 [Actinomadura vinacea]|uniref:Gfo/Idh/MocA family oxidoreductase n=1 Tax=Actinomadura vinacea TaxID=115336 RepID=A0ABN3IJQ1_9ACTN